MAIDYFWPKTTPNQQNRKATIKFIRMPFKSRAFLWDIPKWTVIFNLDSLPIYIRNKQYIAYFMVA